MATAEIRVDRTLGGRVAWVTFESHEKGNVITMEVLTKLHEQLDALEKDPPRVLVLRGSEKDFSRGAAIEHIQELGPKFRDYIASEFKLFDRVDRLPYVTIAMMNGIVIGNAAELALACDLRIAADNARFALPEVSIGFVAPAQRLTRFVGIGKAKEILLGGIILSAEEAHDLTIFSKLVAAEKLEAEIEAIAETYAEKPPIAIRVTKKGLAAAYRFDDADYAAEEEAAFMTFNTEDALEGFASVAERRKPEFKGK